MGASGAIGRKLTTASGDRRRSFASRHAHFCLTVDRSRSYVSAHVAEGRDRRRRVHRRRPRPRRARRRWARGGRARVDPRAQRGGRAPPGGGTRPPPASRSWWGPTTSTWSTSAPRTTSTTSSRTRLWRPASTSSARSPWPSTWRGAERLAARAGSTPGRLAAVPFVYRFYPMVHEARGRVASGDGGRGAPDPRHLPAGLAARPPRTPTGASTPRSAARPGRSPTSARTGATSSSSSPATASPAWRRAPVTAVPERRPSGNGPAFARERRRRRAAAGRDRGRRRRPVRDRRRGARRGRSSSARSRRGARTASGSRWTRADAVRGVRPGAPRHAVGGGRDASTLVRRDPGVLTGTAGRLSRAAAGPPAGLPGLLRRFRRRHLSRRSDRRSTPPTGCPRSPTARGPPRSPTPSCARRATAGGWRCRRRQRGGGGPVKLGFLTACLPRAAARGDRRVGRRRRASRRSRWRRGRDLGDRPFTATHVAADALRRPARPSASRALLGEHGLDAVVARLLRQQPPPRPDGARGGQRPPARAASTPPPLLGAARPSARSSAATRAARSPRTCARPSRSSRRWSTTPASRGVQADHRELRDGGLAPRRLPRQPRLLAGAVGVDVLPRALPQLRPVPPAVDGDRPGRGA